MQTLALGPTWLDPDYLLNQFGLWGLLLIVFAESGLLIGFFLPGDSLLFTTGLLITTGKLDTPLWLACILICIAAIAGDQAGYLFGKKVGPSLFNRPDSKLFKQENVVKAHEFFEKHGPKSLVLARFVPIVRTFTPIIAGVSGMRYRSFITFNVIGGILWGAGVTLLGAWLGKHEFVHKNIEAILILIVLISVVPIIIEFLRARSQKKKAAAQAPAAAPASPAAQDDTSASTPEAARQYQHPGQQPQYPGQQQHQQHQQSSYPGQYPDQSQYQAQRPQYPGGQYQQQYQHPGQQPQHQQYGGQADHQQYASPYEGQQQYQQPQQPYPYDNQYDNQYGNQYEGQHGGQYAAPSDGQQYQAQQPYPHQQAPQQHQQGQYPGQQPQHPEEPQQGHPRY
ncbi:DedA family protein [Streptomyces sp. AN091965]|uniref:DedA family protein n=1 Tax=Streptomyces sp. AN091965 TaxID=2927803 RepID=UPI001F6051EF|nr:VTT domain-containing protein [Streptomyces sp. AN091965]MCI3932173.1 VTT domain-containing protein [Streptomyces sp. AN091965]